jgi:hypothetical protein
MRDDTRRNILLAGRVLLMSAALFFAALSAWAFIVLGTAPRLQLVFASFFAAMVAFISHLATTGSNPVLSRWAGLLSSGFALLGLILLML